MTVFLPRINVFLFFQYVAHLYQLLSKEHKTIYYLHIFVLNYRIAKRTSEDYFCLLHIYCYPRFFTFYVYLPNEQNFLFFQQRMWCCLQISNYYASPSFSILLFFTFAVFLNYTNAGAIIPVSFFSPLCTTLSLLIPNYMHTYPRIIYISISQLWQFEVVWTSNPRIHQPENHWSTELKALFKSMKRKEILHSLVVSIIHFMLLNLWRVPLPFWKPSY